MGQHHLASALMWIVPLLLRDGPCVPAVAANDIDEVAGHRAIPRSCDQLLQNYQKENAGEHHHLGIASGIEEVIVARENQGLRCQDVARPLALRLKTSQETAAVVLDAFLAFEAIQDLDEDELSDRQLVEVESLQRQAVQLAARSPDVVSETAMFYSTFDRRIPNTDARLVEIVRTSPSPGDVSLGFARGFKRSRHAVADVVRAALERIPDHPILIAQLASQSRTLSGRAALYEWAAQESVHRGWRRAKPRVVEYFERKSVQALLDAGLYEEALERFRTLPAPVKAGIAGGASATIEGRVGDLPYAYELPDLRDDMEGAVWLRDVARRSQPGGARSRRSRTSVRRGKDFLKGQDSVSGVHGPAEMAADVRTLHKAILDALETPARDAFEVSAAVMIRDGEWGYGPADDDVELPGNGALRSLLWQDIFARLLEAQGQTVEERDGLMKAVTWFAASRASVDGPASNTDPDARIAASVARLDRAVSNLIARFERRAEELERATRESLMSSELKTSDLLRAPRRIPYVERTLPRGVVPTEMRSDVDDDEPAGEAQDDTEEGHTPKLPQGYSPVRWEIHGGVLYVIADSQNLDAVGEVSPGAYWVLRSCDEGKTWLPPLYTGIKIYAPYVVHRTSHLPLVNGRNLQIEVSVHELDESSITFPPIALQSKRTQDGLYLELPMDELERDGDQDGLTDLVEDKLVTDPDDRDTDADGTPDGDDPLPNVAYLPATDLSHGAMLKALGTILGNQAMTAIIEPVRDQERGEEPWLTSGWRGPALGDATTFILGPREMFRAVEPSSRLIVISTNELEAMNAKFGRMYPLRFTHFLMNRTKTRAFVEWTEGWRGGSFLLEKAGSSWTVNTVSSWIT